MTRQTDDMMFAEDKYYIDKVLTGDESAFSFLVEKHKHMAYTLALRMVKIREDAEEVAQDAFVKAFYSLKNFRYESKFSTWLYKIIYHISITRLRKKQFEVISIDDDYYRNFDITETGHFLDQLSLKEQNGLIHKAIGRLSAEEGAHITLYYLGESSIKELATITGESKSNIKVKLYRARKKLWILLKNKFKDQTITQYE